MSPNAYLPLEGEVAERIQESPTIFTLRVRLTDPAASRRLPLPPRAVQHGVPVRRGRGTDLIVADPRDETVLGHTIRALETRLGLQLLTRTTRSVAPTEAGGRLLATVGPRFEEIEAELAAITGLREKPAGTIRITTAEHAANSILWPKLAKFLPDYPDIKVESQSKKRA